MFNWFWTIFPIGAPERYIERDKDRQMWELNAIYFIAVNISSQSSW